MKYELIIKEIESGEVVRRAEGDCIIGAIASMDDEEIKASSLNYCDGKIGSGLGVIAAAQDVIDEFKQLLFEDFKETCGEDVSIEMLDNLIKVMARGNIGERKKI